MNLDPIHKSSEEGNDYRENDEDFIFDKKKARKLSCLVVFAFVFGSTVFIGLAGAPKIGEVLGVDVQPWMSIVEQHFLAIIGLPSAAFAALIIVTGLRIVEGPIEFKGLGVEFKGASGPVVMWIAVFIAIALGLKWLWPLTK